MTTLQQSADQGTLIDLTTEEGSRPAGSSAADPFPVVNPWVKRGGGAPYVPGNPQEILDRLRVVLRAVDENKGPEHELNWPSGGTTVLQEAVQWLSTSGLIAREGVPSRYVLTAAGRRFLDDRDELFLVATFHANIRFFGEILAELGDGLTHAELNALAKEKYGLAWSSLDQVRRRVYWLRATGVVDYWSNNRIVLTDVGKALLDRLTLADPVGLGGDEGSPALPPPSSELAAYLDSLDDAALHARTRVIGYIAGGINTATIRLLVEEALSPIPRARFIALCSQICRVKPSSAEHTLNTFKSLGVMEQVGADAFCATPPVAEWVSSSGTPLDLVRILHGKVALVGELLDVMSPRTDAGRITRALASAYPKINLSRDEVTRRLVFLKEAGLVERLGNQLRRTPAGASFAKSVRLLPQEEDGSADHESGTGSTDHRSVVRQAQERLMETALNSAEPQRFETAVADAFRLLGVDVEQLGGGSKTDALISLWVSPTDRVKVAVEAKTDSGGVVTEQDVKFPALAEHRKRHGARVTLLIGPSFNRRLTQWAADEEVVLVTARQLADSLNRQASAPLYPRELSSLLTEGDSDARERVWRRVERRQSVVAHVLDIMWKSANDPVDIEYGQGALGVSEIWRESKTLLDNPMDRSEIEEALSFLSTPLLSAVSRVGHNHVVNTPPVLVAARLRMLADMIENRGKPIATRPYRSEFAQPAAPKAERRPERPDVDPSAVRAWATANGRAVSQRGRLPATLIDAFRAASAGQTPTLPPEEAGAR
ncbi:histone-like nucleoid-structuring protein Lsr2 [Actinosynnema sp. NPDC059335]|uniref:Lsr2 family DNA-binding protein n=1 Tax=Actinosynnema sp. NPDC059335 TaxID=3346804 RepID=UPI00366D55D6